MICSWKGGEGNSPRQLLPFLSTERKNKKTVSLPLSFQSRTPKLSASAAASPLCTCSFSLLWC